MIARLQREASAVELGATSLKSVMVQRLRISGKEAKRRLADAKELGPRTALNGEPLDPLLAPTATAQSSGSIGPEHVTEIRSFLDKLPARVDPEVRELSEKTLVVVGSSTGPEEVRKAAEKLAAAIDQDGPEPDDRDRARKRGMTIGPQQADGMSRLTGLLDPEARATLEPAWPNWPPPACATPTTTNPAPPAPRPGADRRRHPQPRTTHPRRAHRHYPHRVEFR